MSKNPVEMPDKPDRCRLPRAGTYALTTTWRERGAIATLAPSMPVARPSL